MNLIEQALLDAKIAKGRADKATKEPWVEPDDGSVGSIAAANGTKVAQAFHFTACDTLDINEQLANADFIRSARSDVPKLSDHVEVLAKRLDVANGHLLGWLYRKAGRVVPGITNDTRAHLAICGINVSEIDRALAEMPDSEPPKILSRPSTPEAYRYRIVYLVWNTGTAERVAVGVCYQERGQPARLYWTRRPELDPRRAAFSEINREILERDPTTEESIGPQTVLGAWRYVESMPAIPLEKWVASLLGEGEGEGELSAEAATVDDQEMSKELAEALRVALDRLECANEIILRDVMCEDDIDDDCAETSTWIAEGRELLAKCDAAVAK